MLYPEVQKRAQDELDATVGRARVPTFADLPRLPYISAIIKESIRWRPVTPLGVHVPFSHGALISALTKGSVLQAPQKC